MQYLVIGGAGFIGSHIVDLLIEQGHNVYVMDNLISGNKGFLHAKAKFVWGDIRSTRDVERVFEKFSPIDRCINLAAQPYIPNCYDDPELFFETNANGTLNILRACEKFKVGKFLQYASAEEYGTQKGKINEQVAVNPQSTYGVSKVAADYLCQVRHRESGVHAIALRQFNCYGPRETHEYVIPEIISQLAAGSTVHLGNIKAERDFLFVRDAAKYAVELLEKGQPGEIYNLGASSCISIEMLARVIGRLMGHDSITIEIDPKKLRPWDIERLEADNTKIHQIVEYRPKTSFEDGLRLTIEYFKRYGWHF
jgi:nucleoside-diphosphate-sugar epimerase